MEIMRNLGLEYLDGANRIKARLDELNSELKDPMTCPKDLRTLNERTKVLYIEYLEMRDTGNKLINYRKKDGEERARYYA